MPVEMSVSSAAAKRRAIHTLREVGYQVSSGPIRLAYPFSVLVEDVDDVGEGGDVDAVVRLVRSVDPAAGTITTAPTLV